MRVTVMSPATADVTIAQATAWLERNRWVADGVSDRLIHFRDTLGVCGVSLPSTEDAPYSSEVTEESIRRVALVARKTPGDVLREMSEVRL